MNINMLSNAVWMMSEKIVAVFGLIFVTSYVAKTFGPVVFGQITFTSSLFLVVQTAAIFGTETILFRSFSKNMLKGLKLMSAVRKMRLTILILLSIPLLAYILYFTKKDYAVFAFASFLSAIFVTQDTFSVFNNARLTSRINTIANAIGMVFSFLTNFCVAWLKLSPIFLTLSIVMITLIPYVIKRWAFYQGNYEIPVLQNKQKIYFRYLLYAGLPLAISSIFVSIQIKTAQFFLAGVSSAHELGLFAAANTVASSWIFVPVAIITSCFTEIFKARGEIALKLTARLHGYVLVVSFFMLFLVTVYSEKIIFTLYGPDYTQSGSLVTILSLATCFSAMGTVAYRFMVKEGGFNYLLKKIISLMIISVPTSYFLILSFGLIGAAWSVFITELLSLTLMNYFFKNGIIKKIQVSSLNYKTYLWGDKC